MNWVDLIIIALVIFFAFEGARKSFIGEVLYLLSFVLSFFLSLRFYNLVSVLLESQFQIPHSLSNVLGFIMIWFVMEAIIFPLVVIAIPKLKLVLNVDRLLSPLSFIPSLLRGLIFVAILLILVGTFPIHPGIKVAIQNSMLGTLILEKSTQLESPLKNLFGGISQDTLTFLTIKPRSDERVNLGFQTQNFHIDELLEDKMVDLVNKERVQRGLMALAFDANLRDVGRGHSTDMFSRGYFSHYSPEGKTVADRAQARGINFNVIGENLAYAPTLELSHNGLMNSPGHRANILSPDYNKIGIGIMDGGIYGLMITQVFSN